MHRSLRAACFIFLTALASLSAAQTIGISVDLTDAPRNIYHAKLAMPAKPGPLTLVYPEWIPGNHRPSGPIANLVGLHIDANGQPVAWERDSVDMYAFHLIVPPDAKELNVTFDAITNTGVAGSSGPSASTHVLDLNWNQVVLYPQGVKSDDVTFSPSITLPTGWKFGTALRPAGNAQGSVLNFQPVSLTTLVDSPLIAGDHYKQIQLTPGQQPAHFIDMVSESEEGLAMTPQDEAAYKKLVAEAFALFGARHYTQYHFLFTMSDEVGGRGLEHHESSDNGVKENALTDSDSRLLEDEIAPHEYVHSWNGKYRRPAGLATKNYQDPMEGDLLWVYEGLTDYLGNILTVRSGLRTPEQFREWLATTAAMLDHEPGRTWRPLEDTARSVQVLRLGGPEWTSWRRSLDYYPEGDLIWLEVDTLIRQKSDGKKSIDDFCRIFHGGESGPPKVVPYTFDDVVNTLNQVVAYNWATLLKQRVNEVTTHAPLGGIEQGGWKLVYTDQPNAFIKSGEKVSKGVNAAYSLGLRITEDGKLTDVIYGSPAYQAGIGPDMKLVAVNGRKYSKDVLNAAIKNAAVNKDAPIDLLVMNADFFKTYSIPYHDGLKYPHLERATGPDLIDAILTPLTK
ncbi:MAG TPA: M61 family peptidase [Terriglobales bacterium]